MTRHVEPSRFKLFSTNFGQSWLHRKIESFQGLQDEVKKNVSLLFFLLLLLLFLLLSLFLFLRLLCTSFGISRVPSDSNSPISVGPRTRASIPSEHVLRSPLARGTHARLQLVKTYLFRFSLAEEIHEVDDTLCSFRCLVAANFRKFALSLSRPEKISYGKFTKTYNSEIKQSSGIK